MRELISAESNGGIRLWDIRMRGAVASLPGNPHKPRNLRALSVHEHAPVFATGGADHTIRVYNTSLKHLSSFEPYMSYLRMSNTPRTAPITATAFHPHRMMLACGSVPTLNWIRKRWWPKISCWNRIFSITCSGLPTKLEPWRSSDASNCARAIGGHRSPILQCTECSFDGREENDSFFGVGAAR